MADSELSQHTNTGGIVSNEFGEHYLFEVNRRVFQGTDASTVFRSYFSKIFEENTFYVITGTDSGLLYQYVKAQGVPEGSRYLFVELPEILEQLINIEDVEQKIVVTTAKDWMQQALQMDMLDYAVRDRLILYRSLGVIHGHYNGYPSFSRKLKEEFDIFVRDQQIALNSRPFTLRQIENLAENQIPSVYLKETFKGKTAVLLAGGPSLDEILPWVKQQRQNLLVIAVSRISHSLLKADIQPDIIVSVDPYAINMNVSKEMLEFNNDTLLVSEFHLNPNLLSSWGGPKVFIGQRYPWPTDLEPENLPSAIGATVTNTAFAIAVEMGISQLILGGVDFCFSQEGYTHASGSAEHALGPRPMYGNQRVRTNNGMMADSINAFLNSANAITIQAKDATARGCLTINPAPNAMRLPYVEHLPLEIIEIEPLEQPANKIIVNSLPTNGREALNQLYIEELGEVDRILSELKTINMLSKKALGYNEKLFNKKEKGSGLHNKTKLENIEKQLEEKHPETANFVKKYGIHQFIPILRNSENGKENIEKNSKIYFQAYADVTSELIENLRQARKRILCRIEEEKPQPNIQHLIEQWQRDKQPGRAAQWVQHHKDYVDQLPESLRQDLFNFQITFDDTIEKLNKEYMEGIEEGVKLDGLAGRAREYFLCKDNEGLQSLMASLEKHHEEDQAQNYIPLVRGYLAELRDDTEQAITEYQLINEGPAYIDALMRSFELHIKSADMAASLNTLKVLSCISSTYTPMYAELLQATGDIDASVDIYTEYLLANPDDLNTMMKLGKLYEQHGVTDGVIMTMNYILDKDSDNRTAKAMLASVNK